jgi:hypothetical protein
MKPFKKKISATLFAAQARYQAIKVWPWKVKQQILRRVIHPIAFWLMGVYVRNVSNVPPSEGPTSWYTGSSHCPCICDNCKYGNDRPTKKEIFDMPLEEYREKISHPKFRAWVEEGLRITQFPARSKRY